MKQDKEQMIRKLDIVEVLEILFDKLVLVDDYTLVLHTLNRLLSEKGWIIFGKIIALIPDDLKTSLLQAMAAGMTGNLYESYGEYLRSSHWKETRDAALQRAGGRCCVCGGTDGISVHHRSYERLGAETEDDLVVLCRSCHAIFHGAGKIPSPADPQRSDD